MKILKEENYKKKNGERPPSSTLFSLFYDHTEKANEVSNSSLKINYFEAIQILNKEYGNEEFPF